MRIGEDEMTNSVSGVRKRTKTTTEGFEVADEELPKCRTTLQKTSS